MQNRNLFGLFLTTLIAPEFQKIDEELRPILEEVSPKITAAVMAFLGQGVSPPATFQLEKELERVLREIGRRTLETVFNRLEPEDPEGMPKRFAQQQQEYSRKQEKSNNRGGIGTCFGTIPLRRFSCEPLQEAREDGQKSFAALELQLGIVAGKATPALAERVAYLAVGHTQQEVLRQLTEDCGVLWSVDVLRKVTAAVSAGMAAHLHQAQKLQILEWLRQADGSKGRRAIVLAVGRDGIMLPIRGEKTYKEGAVATIAVYDRRGRRLGTVYLGQMPEPYQTTLSEQLTRMLSEVLGEWSGCWPRLAYVTDAGYHPTEYFENVLESMEDPRHPGRRLTWTRISAYNYLNKHQEWMDYCEYRRHGLPIGSGVTEAACKTVFTQRFKESGMTWKLEGGQTILVLRLAQLSGVWKTVYSAFLQSRPLANPTTKPTHEGFAYAKAA